MRYECGSCNKAFNLSDKAMCCPYCGNTSITNTGKTSALKKIAEYNKIADEIEALMQQVIPLYLESECILSTLRVYKARGIISKEEMPTRKTRNLQSMLSEYRKNRKGEKS